MLQYLSNKKKNVSVFTLKRFLKEKSFQFRYPDAHQEPSRGSFSWLILASLFPFIRTQQNTTSSKELCFFHLFVHLTKKHLTLGSSSLCCP